MNTLKNGNLSLSFDDNGMITSLFGLEQYDFVKESGLWRIIYQQGSEQEIELLASGTDFVGITYTEKGAELVHESEFVQVRIEVELKDDSICFNAEIGCKADILIREFQFPYFNMGDLPDFSLIRSSLGGARFDALKTAIAGCHTGYMGTDNKAVTMNELYPGEAATNCFCIFSSNCGLYFGSHDNSFQATLHHLRQSDNGICATFVKYPFLQKGASARIEGFTLAPFNGDWHQAALVYRRWADTWFKPSVPPQWVCDFNGWQRLIMRHQYGQSFFQYTDLPQMLADGMASGLDSLLLFGWWTEGMDAGYPGYMADEEQGGFDVLHKQICKTQEAGGKIMLYFNGQLIDHDSEFYRSTGSRVAVKIERGDEHTEVYNFGGEGTSLRQFGNRVFSTACFSCQEWVDTLKSCVDKAINLDVDCVFFDQFGMKLWPCFDASHDHPVPDMRGFDRKANVVEDLRRYVDTKKPGMAFGTEMISDRLAPHVDFFHTVNCGYGRNWRGGEAFLEWFRFMFPEIIISDREIRDDKGDYVHRTNHALQMGLKSDVEIYRCRATITEAPKYAKYMKDINQLRREFHDYICAGRFVDDVPFVISDSRVRAKAFEYEDKLLIIATHKENEAINCQLSVQSYQYAKANGLGVFSIEECGNHCEVVLEPGAIAGFEFQRYPKGI